jgi:hypothetical protein
MVVYTERERERERESERESKHTLGIACIRSLGAGLASAKGQKLECFK